MKEYSIKELAERVSGEIQGDPNLMVTGLCALNAPKEGCISFCSIRSISALVNTLKEKQHHAIFIKRNLEIPSDIGTTCIAVDDPQRALISIIPLFKESLIPTPSISSKADISSSAKIGKNVFIGAFSVIGDDCVIEDGAIIHPHVVLYKGVTIGKNAVIHSGAVIREFCEIGEHVIIQNGAVIGADGFGYIPNPDGTLLAVPQIGNVSLGKNAEVGANTCIDRAALGVTKIGEGTKIDNQVQIGHNVSIGNHSIVCGQGGIAGSAEIGDHVVLGARVGVADHVKVATGCRFGAGTVLPQNITKPGDYAGYPAMPAMDFRRSMNIMKKLPSIFATIQKQQKVEKGNEN